MRTLITQLTRFGLVGTIGLVIDVGIFNLLRITVLAPEVLHEGPVIAKIISTSLAIVANWMGNRYWTFHRERRRHPVREGVDFFLVSIGGMLIGLGCLFVSHYVLGFDSLLADNVSSNVIGLALGTVFRFWLYRVWVFRAVELGQSRQQLRDPSADRAGEVGLVQHEVLRPAQRTVVPAGFTPLHRIQAVATVDDGARANE